MRIKLDELKDIVFLNCKEEIFTGYTTKLVKDIYNNDYEILGTEEKYIYLYETLGTKTYISETLLLETLLIKEISTIDDGTIYEHGYPESRLIPSNHYAERREGLLENVIEDVSDKIREILEGYFKY